MEREKKNGIACPKCGDRINYVTHTYHHEFSFRGKFCVVTRRRRACRNCGSAFYTSEHIEQEAPFTQPLDNPFI